MSTDLTFLTNEPGKALGDRFHALLADHTRHFDCLVGHAHRDHGQDKPREVILSSVICEEEAT
jgi:hypothetical protein